MVRYLDSGLLPLVPVNTNTNKKACFNPVMSIHEPCSGAPFPTTFSDYLNHLPCKLQWKHYRFSELKISKSKAHCFNAQKILVLQLICTLKLKMK